MSSKNAGIESQALLHGSVDKGEDNEKGVEASTIPSKTTFGMSTVLILILYYAACSSTMLLINKVTIHFLPAPAFVLTCQLAVSAIVVRVLDQVGVVKADKFQWDKVLKFSWVVVGFLGTIFCNIKVLQNSNVETFITFRASTPIVLSLCDYFFLGRAWPNVRSWICIFFLAVGAFGYVMMDAAFKIEAYVWLFLWYLSFVFDTVYAKHMCESVEMTNWGRVYYTNAMALPPMLMVLPMLNEHKLLMEVDWNLQVLGPLILSCLMGIAMSHAAYVLRDALSTTYYTIIGILCKVLTVILNVMMWDKHAGIEGIGMLLICVLAGTFYEQAPKRSNPS